MHTIEGYAIRNVRGQIRNHTKSFFLRKSSAPRSEAARDKWLLQKKQLLRKSSAPGSEAARDKWLLQNKSDF